MNIWLSVFFPLLFKKFNKLDEYIYNYFFIIPIILLNSFSIIKIKIIVRVIKKTTNIRIFIFNQNQNFIKKNTVHNFQTLVQ